MTLPPLPLVRLEVPDYDLGLRGKAVRPEKAAPGKRIAFCTIVYGMSVVDEVVDTPLGSVANGYPDAFAVPDEATRVVLPWKRSTEAVIADMVHDDGRPVAESPRTVVTSLLAQYQALDLEPVLGYEYEVYLTPVRDAVRRDVPVASTISGYGLSRLDELMPIVEEFLARMAAIGAPVEAFHTEIGPGFFEFALAPAPALTATDNAARARQLFRELCAEHGIRATFMAKLYAGHSGSGGHVHQSLRRGGVNVFGDGSGGLSEHGSAYVGGLLATMGDLTAMLNPFVNSYKRVDPDLFVATRATWGLDTRSAACRAILNVGEAGARVEHRRPGADASPYLVTAAVLAGGLHGLRHGIDPGPPLLPGDDLATSGGPVPSNLREAVERFEASPLAVELLGQEFVTTFALTRRGELAAYEKWLADSITDWELARYPDHL